MCWDDLVLTIYYLRPTTYYLLLTTYYLLLTTYDLRPTTYNLLLRLLLLLLLFLLLLPLLLLLNPYVFKSRLQPSTQRRAQIPFSRAKRWKLPAYLPMHCTTLDASPAKRDPPLQCTRYVQCSKTKLLWDCGVCAILA